ncbi:MAG: cupin domain-containing protein [Candidatus Bathyarchaeia archaeon]
MKKMVVSQEEAFSGDLPAGGKFRILLDEEIAGARNFSLLLNEMHSETGSEHAHEVEHAFFILSGRGKYSIGGKEYDVGPGMALFAPAGAMHRLRKVGPEPLSYLVIYAPPGPEKELRLKGKGAFKRG